MKERLCCHGRKHAIRLIWPLHVQPLCQVQLGLFCGLQRLHHIDVGLRSLLHVFLQLLPTTTALEQRTQCANGSQCMDHGKSTVLDPLLVVKLLIAEGELSAALFTDARARWLRGHQLLGFWCGTARNTQECCNTLASRIHDLWLLLVTHGLQFIVRPTSTLLVEERQRRHLLQGSFREVIHNGQSQQELHWVIHVICSSDALPIGQLLA
mmetsp:Transcript_11902/g.26207  ORF Transcript_11902/g.26207 Transcript_11902/m.26207 type:complete len:210 (-) Transcript_11902:996-1625(-)